MRIAYVSVDFGIPVHGNKGASIHVRELSSALALDGHDIKIFASRRGGEAPAAFDIPVYEVRMSATESKLIASLKDSPIVGEPVAKEVRSMVYATSFKHAVLPKMREWRPDAIYERYALLGTAGIDLARELGIPHILEVNAPLSEEHAQYRGSAFAETIRTIERQILGATDRVIAVSEPLRDWVVAAGVDADCVTVAPNGVNLDRFSSPSEGAPSRSRCDARPAVGFVGTLKAWHGTATLIQAVGLLAQERGIEGAPRLLIVGDGPEREQLERIVLEEGITTLTTFTGLVEHEQMPMYIAAMDIAVAPYDETPGFYFSPLKLFEYMAAGRPIVAAGIGQIKECLRDGETGLLYPPGDVHALADRIGQLMDQPNYAQNLGYAAREEARRHHGWDRNAWLVTSLIERERSRTITSARAEGGE